MWHGVVPTKIFKHQNLSCESFIVNMKPSRSMVHRITITVATRLYTKTVSGDNYDTHPSNTPRVKVTVGEDNVGSRRNV